MALALGCGGDKPTGIEVTEAADDARLPSRPRVAPLDTVYADLGVFADSVAGLDALRADSLRRDSLRADSLRRDSLRADSLRQDSLRRDSVTRAEPAAAAPDFRTFWPRFQTAFRAGLEPTLALAQLSADLSRRDVEAAVEAASGAPFRAGVRALSPRDFRRDGTARQATVTVGYDRDGAIVPQDEAVTEAALTLSFDVVEGGYRLVAVSLSR